LYPADLEGLEDLADAPDELCRGGSAIISPLGAYLAGPLYGAEGILYADLSSSAIAEGKFDFDVIGHYARNDIFSFAVNEAPQTSATDIRDAEAVRDVQEETLHLR
jgi:nitrilase